MSNLPIRNLPGVYGQWLLKAQHPPDSCHADSDGDVQVLRSGAGNQNDYKYCRWDQVAPGDLWRPRPYRESRPSIPVVTAEEPTRSAETPVFRELCAELIGLEDEVPDDALDWRHRWKSAVKRTRAALRDAPEVSLLDPAIESILDQALVQIQALRDRVASVKRPEVRPGQVWLNRLGVKVTVQSNPYYAGGDFPYCSDRGEVDGYCGLYPDGRSCLGGGEWCHEQDLMTLVSEAPE